MLSDIKHVRGAKKTGGEHLFLSRVKLEIL